MSPSQRRAAETERTSGATANRPSATAEPGIETQTEVPAHGSARTSEGFDRTALRRWRAVAITAALVFAAALFLGLLTQGTFDPGFRSSPDPQGLFYDGQARAILDGRLDVPTEAIGAESFVIHGHRSAYFGVTPAIVRLPVMALYPTGYPNLTPWTYLLAFLIEALAILGILRCAERQFHFVPTRWTPMTEGVFLFAVLAGSANLFLAARPDVYEEAILWGVAFTLVTMWAALRLLEAPTWKWTTIGIVGAVLAIESRPTLGGGAVLALGLTSVVLVWRDRRRWPMSALLGVGGLLALVSYCLVNYLKFNSLINPPWQYHVSLMNDPQRLARYRQGTTSLRFLPTSLVEYLRPDTLHFVSAFPWIKARMPQYASPLIIGNVKFDGVELPASITATMPVLTALALVGTVLVLLRRSAVLAPIVAGIATILVTSSFFGLSQRYLGDFLPWLVVSGSVGIVTFANWQPNRRWVKPTLAVLAVAGIVWSAFANLALGYQYQLATHIL